MAKAIRGKFVPGLAGGRSGVGLDHGTDPRRRDEIEEVMAGLRQRFPGEVSEENYQRALRLYGDALRALQEGRRY